MANRMDSKQTCILIGKSRWKWNKIQRNSERYWCNVTQQ